MKLGKFKKLPALLTAAALAVSVTTTALPGVFAAPTPSSVTFTSADTFGEAGNVNVTKELAVNTDTPFEVDDYEGFAMTYSVSSVGNGRRLGVATNSWGIDDGLGWKSKYSYVDGTIDIKTGDNQTLCYTFTAGDAGKRFQQLNAQLIGTDDAADSTFTGDITINSFELIPKMPAGSLCISGTDTGTTDQWNNKVYDWAQADLLTNESAEMSDADLTGTSKVRVNAFAKDLNDGWNNGKFYTQDFEYTQTSISFGGNKGTYDVSLPVIGPFSVEVPITEITSADSAYKVGWGTSSAVNALYVCSVEFLNGSGSVVGTWKPDHTYTGKKRPATVTLDKTAVTVKEGETATVTASVSDGSAVFWSSSDTEVATVSGGVITGVAEGTARITASAGGGSAVCTVTVTSAAAPEVVPAPAPEAPEGAPAVELPAEAAEELAAAVDISEDVLTDEEKAEIAATPGAVEIKVYPKLEEVPAEAAEEHKTAVETAIATNTETANMEVAASAFVDISVYKKVGNAAETPASIKAPVTITVKVPDSVKQSGGRYALVHITAGGVEILGFTDGDSFTVNVSSFSPFAVLRLERKPLPEGVLWQGNLDLGTNWDWETQRVAIDPYAAAKEGDVITVRVSAINSDDYHCILPMDGYGTHLEAGQTDVTAAGDYSFTLNAADAESIKTNGLSIMGSGCTVTLVSIESSAEPEPPAPPADETVYYSVSGDVNGSYEAGTTVNVTAPFGKLAYVYENGRVIAKISGSGSFVMPASNVTVSFVYDDRYDAIVLATAPNAYIYSYDSSMNKLRIDSSNKGTVTVKLGAAYAGKTVTLYSGKGSTSEKVGEAVLDANGNATFDTENGKNYSLVVED